MTHPNLYTQLYLSLDSNEITEPSPDLLTNQWRRFTSSPDIVLQPRSVESVQNIMRFCFKHKIPVTPQDGNTGLCGATVAENGILLNLSKFNRIREINLADNSITVDAGAVLQNVQQAAVEVRRLFPLSLANQGSCEIGGNIACNVNGLNILRYGTIRGLVLGLEAVLPGDSLASYLHPLHKNTTGYDLYHLFIDSEGTLGVIIGASLRLLALSQTTAAAWVGLPDIKSAARLLTLIQGHFAERPCNFELISYFTLKLSSGFSNVREPVEAEWHILPELTDSVPDPELADRLAELLFEYGLENSVLVQSEQERNDLWALRGSISTSQRSLDTSIKYDITLPIARVVAFVHHCVPALKARFVDIEIVCFGYLGDDGLHYNTFLPRIMSSDVHGYEGVISTIVYENVLQDNDAVAAEHGVDTIKKHQLPRVRIESELVLMRVVEAHLDPYNIVNPGKLLPQSSEKLKRPSGKTVSDFQTTSARFQGSRPSLPHPYFP